MYRLAAGDAAALYGYDSFGVSEICGGVKKDSEERSGADDCGCDEISKDYRV